MASTWSERHHGCTAWQLPVQPHRNVKAPAANQHNGSPLIRSVLQWIFQCWDQAPLPRTVPTALPGSSNLAPSSSGLSLHLLFRFYEIRAAPNTAQPALHRRLGIEPFSPPSANSAKALQLREFFHWQDAQQETLGRCRLCCCPPAFFWSLCRSVARSAPRNNQKIEVSCPSTHFSVPGLSIQSCRQSILLARRFPSPTASPSPNYVVPAVATAAVGIGERLLVVHRATCSLLPTSLRPDQTLLRCLVTPVESNFVAACPGRQSSLRSLVFCSRRAHLSVPPLPPP